MQTPLASLVRERMAHLGLTMPAVAARLGYTNTNKGSRRLQSMMAGDIAAHRDILSRLAEALEISDESIAEAVRASAALKEQAYRANFVPHAIIVTERTIPSQITFCALTRGEAALRFTLDTTRPRTSYCRQAGNEIDRRTDHRRCEIPFFGRVLGFVVSYDPCRAVRFDLDGRALGILSRSPQVGQSHWSIR